MSSDGQKVLEAFNQRIILDELVGPHLLSRVEPGVEHRQLGPQAWEDANTLAFILGEVAYIAIENPDDGYRSTLSQIQLAPADVVGVGFRFPPVKVTAVRRVPDSYIQCDIIDFIDDVTGEVVLSVGTDNTVDYYPMCVLNWNPKGLCLNKKG